MSAIGSWKETTLNFLNKFKMILNNFCSKQVKMYAMEWINKQNLTFVS